MTGAAIVFEALGASSAATGGEGSGALPVLRGLALETAGPYGLSPLPALSGEAVGFEGIVGTASAALPRVRGFGMPAGTWGIGYLPALSTTGEYYAEVLVPQSGIQEEALPAILAGSSAGSVHLLGGTGSLSIGSIRGFASEASGTYGIGYLPILRGTAFQTYPSPTNYAILLQDPGALYASSLTIMPDISIADSAEGSDSLESTLDFYLTSAAEGDDAIVFSEFWYLLSEAIADDALAGQLELTDLLVSDAYGRDYLIAAFPLSISDSATGADAITHQLSAMHEMLSEAVGALSAEVMTAVQNNLVSVAISDDAITFGYMVSLSDAAEGADALLSQATITGALSDAGEGADAITGTRAVTIALSENVLATDTLTHQAIMVALLESNAIVHALLSIGDETYDVWVMNTELGAVSTYDNFDFTGFARLGERHFGLREDGIYELIGDDDAGTAISAAVTGGLSNLGTDYKKRIPAIYIGYTSDGVVVAKVVTTDGGEKRENWYELSPIEKTATVEERFEPAKGLKSVYWQFKLAGNNFTLDSVKLWRAITSRRK